ncbi:MAG: alkaline phosphatase D family protein [Limnohabitans sp.]|jgi:alkaline phosphatase D
MDRRTLLHAVSAAALASSLPSCAVPVQGPALPGAGLQDNSALPPWPARLTQIAFGSCIDQKKAQPIWDAILAGRPDLFIFGGDTVYASTQPWLLDNLQKAYSTQAAQPGFARLRQTVAHLAIWDDHDFGLNDGGADFPHKLASKQAFMDFWKLRQDDPRRAREGLYHAQIFGPPGQQVQVILLDERWFRSKLRVTDQRDAPGKERYLPDPNPAKTMLGPDQWRWLEAQLLQSADLRLIVSGVQVIVQGHGWEGWANFPAEQSRLLDLIERTQAKGVVFLSGDRHIGALYRHERAKHYPLFELTSSGMTHAWAGASEAGPNRMGELVTQNHFALVELDWPARHIALTLKGSAGQVLQRHRIALAELD